MYCPWLDVCKLCTVLLVLVGIILCQNCDFEKDLCKWTQYGKDKFDWTRKYGRTGSSGTGPSTDHTSSVKTLPVLTKNGNAKGAPCVFPFVYNKRSSKSCIRATLRGSWCATTKSYDKDKKWGYCQPNGYYVYIETSNPRRKDDNAVLVSPKVAKGPKCFSFWYHMYGPHIDSLVVYTVMPNGSFSQPIWKKTGTQGNKWQSSNVTIQSSGSFQIAVEGIRGVDYKGDISLDDFKVIDGSCDTSVGGGNSSGTCTFEKDKCGFVDAPVTKNVQFTWRRNRGRTSSGGTGPQVDHTLQTRQGYYMYVEASGRKRGDKGRLSKAYFNLPKGGSCLQFYYHMFGAHQGFLNVYVNPPATGSMGKPVFSKSGQQGKLWIKGEVNIPATTGNVVFEGVIGSGYRGDIAIDDITVLPRPCRKAGHCDFQTGLCTWYNLPISVKQDDFDWIIGSGVTSSSFTGPKADRNGDVKGKYLFLEASTPRKNGDKTRLVSELFNQTSSNGQCFGFFYHMFGSNIGALNIYVNSSGQEKLVWKLSGNKGNKWMNGQVNVGLVKGSYKVIIEGVRGNGYRGDIAIDDFTFKIGSCLTVPPEASPSTPQTTQRISTMRPTQPPAKLFSCDFESGICSTWQQDNRTDQLDWTLAKGATSSTGTGPSTDHTKGTKYGQYVYLEVSGKKNNAVARLISTTIAGTTDYNGKCLTFWYHMYGPNVNTLNVYIIHGTHIGKPVWSRKGTQGNRWLKGQVTLTSPQYFKAIFEGSVGSSYRGDIAIDDISLTGKPCIQPSATCTFEGGQCGYIDDRSSDVQFTWTWASKSTGSSGTGPTTDHTKQSINGFYMYTEASGRKIGDKARLLSPVNQGTSGKCLKFWYHMYGVDTGTLSIYLKINNVLQSRPIWSESGNKGNVWKVASTTVKVSGTFQIAFEGKMGRGFRGDIAIDDIELKDGPCPAPGFCDFENGLCSYVNNKNDKFDWIVGSAGTPSKFTGPKFDHTLGTKNGSYVFLEVSAPRKEGDIAILSSQQFNSVGGKKKCLSFWYHMFGADIGQLQIVYKVFSGSQPERLLWNLTGQQQISEMDPWKNGRVPIDMDADHVIMFKGVAGSGYRGDMAIDDIQYTPLACTLEPPEANPNGKATVPPTTPYPRTRQSTLAPSLLGCNFEKDICNLLQDSTDKFNWTRKQGFTDTRGTGPKTDHTFGKGAVQLNGPGSIRHASGKCIHVLNGAFKKPKLDQPLVLYDGCGQERLEFVITPVGYLKLTKWNMCVRLKGGSTSSGAKVGLTDNCRDKWKILTNGALQHITTQMCLAPYRNNVQPSNNIQLVVYKSCAGVAKKFTFVPTMGWYAFIETSSPRKPNDTARLTSKTTSMGKCLNFWYHMYGAHINKLNVYVKSPGGPLGTPLWSKYGSHGDTWKAAHVWMNAKGPYQYVIEAIRGDGYKGDIAIDDISITDKCNGPLECSFEETNPPICGWINAKDDQFDWSIGQGRTASLKTGPKADHTYNDDKGKYLFIETSGSIKAGSIARLVSPNYPGNARQGGQCFQFWYHMFGSSIGRLDLYMQKVGQSKGVAVWTKSLNQGKRWAIGQISITSQGQYQLIFEGVRGASYTGDIALDDLKMYDGLCNKLATCDFENEKCTWKNTQFEDTFDWMVGEGNTPSKWTGPLTDHSKQNGDGKYMFVESSKPRKKGDTARLVSEPIDKHTVWFVKYCLRFWYHMRGSSIGTLNVYIKTGAGKTNEKLVWTLSGNQGYKWHFGTAPVFSKVNYQMVFEAIHGGGAAGDIAIDDVVYSFGRCPVKPSTADPNYVTTPKPTLPPTTAAPTTYSCNFEGKTICHWKQDTTDKFDWRLNSGSTSTIGSGPSADHTLGNTTGTYLYIETSGRKDGDIARLISPYLDSDKIHGHSHCLKFWFHMFGPDVKSLNVYIKTGGTLSKIWTRVGNNGNQWRYGQVDLKSNLKYQVAFEGVRGKNYKGDISIDDIDILDGACPVTKTCDFEHGLCKLTNDPTGQFQWRRNQGATASYNTGPPYDHTLQTPQGFYLYVEASGRRKGDKARVIAQVISNSNPMCLEFWFHMRGAHIGDLNVYVQTPKSGRSLIWKRSGNHGDRWKIARTTIRPRAGRQIVFEGVRGASYSGDIAIDDLTLSDGYCPPPGDCTFENGFCGWNNVKRGNLDKFDWIIGSKGTPTSFTGPDFDHTTGTAAGKYVYIESSTSNNGDTAWLISEDFYPTYGRCVQFWANMYGRDIGELNVYIRNQNGTMRRIWTLSGQQGSKAQWINGQAPVVSLADYQIVFEAVRGSSAYGDIALDDIVFTNFRCSNIPTISVPPDPTTPFPTTPATTTPPTPAPNYYSCNFTTDKCNWLDDKTAQFTWIRQRGKTGSVGTGPTVDHTTGASGWYIYIETSSPRKPNDTARLVSADIPATGQTCLQFWYHMYGDHVENLTVYQRIGGKMNPLWQKSGTQGPRWKHATVDISSASKFQVVFEGIKGSGYRGDIALDDLSLNDGDCPPSAECTFEDPKLCGWSNMVGDNFDWKRDNAGTSSTGTGPRADHTFGTANGFYMYIEASTPRSKGHKAWLKSGEYSPTLGRCLSFWYHMKGTHIGALNVLILQGKSRSAPVWSLSGSQGWRWKPSKVTIKSSVKHSIIFEGVTGPSYKGDIAIDDVVVTDGPCPDYGNCDFERDTCGYYNQRYGDNFDWQIGSKKSSPPTDHSTGKNLGRYMFIQSTSTRLHEYSIITSEVVPVSGAGKCIQFWYYMYDRSGGDVGSLEVNMKVGVTLSETIVWQLQGNQGNRWIQGQAPLLSRGVNLEIRFEGIRGPGKGYIAIDDITVVDYTSCSTLPAKAQPWGCNFELGLCKWQQLKGDDFDWKRNKGHTGSTGTGPSVDHTTNTTKGYYAYIETSWPRKPNDTAAIISPTIRGNGQKQTYCVWFAYHMYGPHVNTLQVYTKSQGLNNPIVWQRKGSRGPQWKHAEVQINVLRDTQVVFEAIRGTSHKGDIAIDDIDIWYGDCFSSGICTFEGADICQWRVDQRSQLKWQRGSGNTQSVKTGPPADHTYGTKAGHYMYIETSVASPNSVAYMYSPWYWNDGQKCVQFYYHMYGDQIGSLTLYLRYSNSRYLYRVFTKSGNQNNTWHEGLATVSKKAYFQIVTKGKKGQGYRGDIAVDDFRIRDGACPAPGDCDFEHGDFCSWYQSSSDTFDWIIGSGKTNSYFTGPNIDHTTQTSGGYYAFIETSSPRKTGDRASIRSMVFQPTAANSRCISFWYHMYGVSIGTLNVYLNTVNGFKITQKQLMWQLQGNQGNKWLNGRFTISMKNTYQVAFEGIRGTSYKGDIAIDDIEFTSGSCKFQPYDAWPKGRTTPTPTPGVTTIGPTAGNSGHDCNFDQSLCSTWKTNATRKEFTWRRHQGKTASAGTGPHHDHTTRSDQGYYVYIESSSPARYNDTAWLIGQNIPNNMQGFCLSFWYHMYGPHAGTLNVYAKLGNLRWRRVGTQGDRWNHGQFYVSSSIGKTVTVIFEGIRGKGYAGDIALDDIQIKTGACPASRECTFEATQWSDGSGLMCGWVQDNHKDDFDWTVGSATTPSVKTGPSSDHTLKTSQGHYVYIETSSPRKFGQTAMMVSQSYQPSNGLCFTFWYHMYGSTIGNLTLFQRVAGVDSPLWQRTTNEGNHWHQGMVTLKSKSQFQVVLQGTVGTSYSGDIAIDDIFVQDGECPLPGDCSFEDYGLCTYEQTQYGDDFDWIRGSGSTGSWRTGPASDNTKKDSSGHYYYIEASRPRKPGDKAHLISQLFEPTSSRGKCLQFYRHMYGSSIGTFNVIVKTGPGNGSDSETLIWTDSGNQGNSWIQSQVPVYSSKPYWLVFEAVRGNSYKGDIGIDDISFNNNFYPCTNIPPGSAPPTLPPTTITPADSNCTFDQGLCRWTQSQSDDFDWTIRKGKTGTSGTGPLGDHTSGNGKYVYIEASYPRKANDTAILKSPPIRPKLGAVCFQFAYHMHGAHVNSLYIYKVYKGRRYRVWKRVGTQGNQWRMGQVNLRGVKSIFTIEVQAIRGIDYQGDIAIDDFLLTNGKCPPKPYCDFENNQCGWRNIPGDKFNWKRSNGGTPSYGTGPKTDHTTQTKLGSYMYIETSSPQKKGDNTFLQSSKFEGSKDGKCLNFWYHMYGQHIGALNIYLNSKNSEPIWNKTDNQGNVWKHGRVTIKSRTSFKILIEGVVGSSYKGDIAIDDIQFENFPCPTPGSCDFEGRSFCMWSQVPNAKNRTGYDNFDWELGSGSTPSAGTGPITDHTKGTALGTYAFIEVSNVATGQKAQLISDIFSPTRGKCLSFWYHMYGRGIGSLNFLMKDTKTAHVMKSINGQQGNRWIKGEVGLHSQLAFQVIIEAVRGTSYNGDISLDDIKIYEGNCVGSCSSVNVAARVACGPGSITAATCVTTYGCCWDDSVRNVPYCFQHPSDCLSIPVFVRTQCGYNGISRYYCTKRGCCYDDTVTSGFKCFYSPDAPTAFPTTVAPPTTPPPSKYDCDFEKGFCGFQNLKGDQFNWQRHKGSTGSWGTGPKADHTLGDSNGYYAYIETSYRKTNDTALLQTPYISFKNRPPKVCVRFWYHMYGQHVGTFNLHYSLTSKISKSPLWQRTGALVNEWMYAQLTVPGSSSFKITFEGVRGPGYKGDIAIDDVGFVNGPCPPRLFCDFENSDLCGWTQDASDDFDWDLGYGNTTSLKTGPKWDHTYKTGFGNYLYIEGSHPRQPGDKARIESFARGPTQGECVEFYFHMKGSGIGTLNVWIRRGKTIDPTPAWTMSGEQGNEWERALITVVEGSQNWRVIIEAIRGSDFNSDIAIDDVHFHTGKCIPKGHCDFEEHHACGYTNLPTNKVDWLVYSGSTPSFNTGPSADHTTGQKSGHYLYIEASSPARKGDKGQLVSEKFKVNPNYKWCVEFWYHMFGNGAGALRVKTRYFSKYSKGGFLYSTKFTQEGNHDDKWLFGQANITSSYDFQVVFEAEVGSGTTHQSDIAIDDLKITQGLCAAPAPPPTPNPCALKCKDGHCIPSTKVCDFYPDCAQRSDPTDNSDEDGCDGCDFEKDKCAWKDTSKGIFDWRRQRGGTGSYGTGPSFDHTKGNALGYYIYVEASRGSKYALATFSSPVIQQSSASCTMTFWYHMYGTSIGELSVYILNGVRLTRLWQLKGNQGKSWQQATVYINRRSGPYQIKFTAERSTSYRGDIAIDDIQLNNCPLPKPVKYCNTRYSWRCANTRACVSYSRKCDFTDDCGDYSDEENCNYRQYPFRCNFEYSFCQWKNLKDDKFDFTRAKGQTDSVGTGPMLDHTTGTSSGYYIYAEASYQRRGDKARLGSGILQPTGRSYCSIRFYYHMLGDHIGRLSVKTRQCQTCQETLVWSRNETVGNFWVRKALRLRSDKPFQVILETERGSGYKGDIAIDDVSFDGCQRYYGFLPTAIPTTPTTPTVAPCRGDQFYCIKDKKCIARKLQCDYKKQCSDGLDEDHCGPCDFEKDFCGYRDISTGKYEVTRSQPLTDGKGNGPTRDHTNNNTKGYFALSVDGTGTSTSAATMESPGLAPTAPGCMLEFYYHTSNNLYTYVKVLHRQDVNKKTVETQLWRKSFYKATNGWQKGMVQLGNRPQGWNLKFQLSKASVSIDDITFKNCAFPPTRGICSRLKVSCDNGACIDPHSMCDYSNDCGDQSDEKEVICKSFKERCNFETDTCSWTQDITDDFDWTRAKGSTGSSFTGPGFDHTTGHRLGYYMYIETSNPRKANDTARLMSAVFTPSKQCVMRFYYHMYGDHVDTLSIKRMTSANLQSPMETLWTKSGNQGDMWIFAKVALSGDKNFKVVLEAIRGSSYKGDIAIDDISFSRECKPDFRATLDPNLLTPSPPPGCKGGQLNCGDGQCIDASKVCDFVYDCKNKNDEGRCPSTCDFEKGDSCKWFNAKYADVMDWKVHQGKTPSNGTGPPYDHTKGTKEGWYAYMEAGQRKRGSFPNAMFVSPLYYKGAHKCSFSFWYNMYHYKSGNDARLNLYFRRSGKSTKLWTTATKTGDQWRQGTVKLPNCPQDFRMIFEGSHYWGTKTDAAIDDLKFECAEPTPPATCNSNQLRCTETRQCISLDSVCDGGRDCCDGSDETKERCKGYTVLDFESGLHGWVQLDNDTFDFDIQSGKTASTGTGPSTDHTLQEEHGKYAYIEASTKQQNDTARLASPTIAATVSGYTMVSPCSMSFWYHMYGTHIGALNVYTATKYGVPGKLIWSMSGDQGDEWKKAKVSLSANKDFQIIVEAKMGTSYRGDIAVDDLWFEPGCKFNGKALPGGPTMPPVDPCLPDFQCRVSGACIPRSQVCDFAKDCPSGSDEDNVTCGYPQGFENGFGAWRNAHFEKYDFQLQQGATPSRKTGPSTDARNDKNGYYAFLEVSNRKHGEKAILTTPSYGGAYADCTMNFYYHMYGKDTGVLRIYLLNAIEIEDTPGDTVLFELRGDQGDKWVKSKISIGRRYEPFYLNFSASVGSGFRGDIAIDEITFENCAHPPLCQNYTGRHMCENGRCVDQVNICNFIDDCGDSTDEMVGGVCSDYLGCNFEDDNMNPCNFTQDKSGDDFDWIRHTGFTPSYNTGPTRDHTYGLSYGHYMYIESSKPRKAGEKARLFSLTIKAKPGGSCQLRFYYHMNGIHTKDLNVYVLRVASGNLIFKYSATGDFGDVWKLAVVDLSDETKVFRLVFEGIVGKSFRSDIAIDDVILNPDCLTNSSRVFPTSRPPCSDGYFRCKSGGNCIANTTKCDGKPDCKDGSDEMGCGGTTDKSVGGKPLSGTSIIAAGAVGGLVVLLIIVLVAYIIIKRRREKKLHLFSVFYDPTKQPEEQKKKGDTKGVSIRNEGVSNPVYDEEPHGEFSMGELDTDMFTDGAADFVVPVDTKGGATSMANPLYQDPYMDDDDGPLSNF